MTINVEKQETYDFIVFRASSKSYENQWFSTFRDDNKWLSIGKRFSF